MSKRGWLLFGALSVLWGVPYLMIRVAVLEIDPVVVAFLRCLIAVAVLLPIAVRSGAVAPALRQWKPLLAFTGVEIVGPWFLLGHAEKTINSSTAGLMIAVVPLIAAVIVTRIGADKLDRRRITGLLVGFGGVAALVGLDIQTSDLAAVAAIAGVALGYATGPILINRYLSEVPPMGVIATSLTIATLVYAPFTPGAWPQHAVSAEAVWSVIGLGLICTAAAFLIFFALVAEAGPARATVITYVNPAVALVLGISILNEPLSAGMLIGFPLVILGSILATAGPRKQIEELTDEALAEQALATVTELPTRTREAVA